MRAWWQTVRAGAATVALAAVGVAMAGSGSAATIQAPASGTIMTVAGGVGGPESARQVAISVCGSGSVCQLAFAAGQLYFPDSNEVVRAVSLATGRLTTPVGNGVPWYGVNGEPATAAQVGTPSAEAVDPAGDLLVADLVRRVRFVAATSGSFFGQTMTAGDIYDIAGGPNAVVTGDAGLGTNTQIAPPVAVAFDQAGNALIGCEATSTAPSTPAQIRIVAAAAGTFYGRAMTAGHIYTVAGAATGMAISGNGGPAGHAGLGVSIGSFQVDKFGNLVIADTAANQVRVVAAASGRFYGQKMTAGDIYAIAGKGTAGFSGDEGPASAAALRSPTAVALDSAGNLVIADRGNNRVRVVAVSSGNFYGQAMRKGRIYTVAGGGTSRAAGSLALNASLSHPTGIAVDSAGNIVIAQAHAYRIWAVAGQAGTFYGVKMASGHLYPIAGTGSLNWSGDGGPAAGAELKSPDGVAVDHAGDLFISDAGHDRVRVVPARTGQLFGRSLRAGHVYTLAGTGVKGTTGTGGPATSAELLYPGFLAVDGAGNVLFTDDGLRLEVVAAATGTFYGQPMITGHLYTIAGTLSGRLMIGVAARKSFLGDVQGLTVAPDGNLFLADSDITLVLMIPVTTGIYFGQKMTADHLYLIAGDGDEDYSGDGGLATRSAVWPSDVAIDDAGNVLIADGFNERIRVVPAVTGTYYGQAMKQAHIYSIAAPNYPLPRVGEAVTLDSSGNVIFADASLVQVLAVTSGTFYGQVMQAGNFYAITGSEDIDGPDSGADGLGDGGPAIDGVFQGAGALAVGPGNDLYVTDGGDNRIREITP